MADQTIANRLKELIREREALEAKLQTQDQDDPTDTEQAYSRLQRSLAQLFKESRDDEQRTTIMLELMRILENKLVYLQNFSVDPTSDNRLLATLVDQFIGELSASGSRVITPLEATYHRAIAALYAGDRKTAREGFRAACESEESDEANDIKYKSYVILGNLSHEDADYKAAQELHDKSMRYSHNDNVTAQALAFKALNAYALRDHDEALSLFEKALTLFNADEPFFNSYFYRNALLFCGAIHYERKNYDKSGWYYKRVADEVDPSSYDYFDAVTHLGRVSYLTGKFEEASDSFDRAIRSHRFRENEHLMDAYFWMAKALIRQNKVSQAKEYLQKVAGSSVNYGNKPQVEELLRRVS